LNYQKLQIAPTLFGPAIKKINIFEKGKAIERW